MLYNIISALLFVISIAISALLAFRSIRLFVRAEKQARQARRIIHQNVQLSEFNLIQSDEELLIKNKGKNPCTEAIDLEYIDYCDSVIIERSYL